MTNWADFKIFVFRFERFLEGPEGVPGGWGRAAGISKGGRGGGSISLWGPEGGPKTKRDPRPTTRGAQAGRKRRPKVPGGIKGGKQTKTKNKNCLSRSGPKARRILINHIKLIKPLRPLEVFFYENSMKKRPIIKACLLCSFLVSAKAVSSLFSVSVF